MRNPGFYDLKIAGKESYKVMEQKNGIKSLRKITKKLA